MISTEDILDSLLYVPTDALFDFIQGSMPGIKVRRMYAPVELDDTGQIMYYAKSYLVGYEDDGEQSIANSCLELLSIEINKSGIKDIGIYGLLKSPMIMKRVTTLPEKTIENIKTDNRAISLRIAFAEKVEDEPNKIEEPYVPQYTKHVEPFHYDQEELMQRIQKDNE